MKVCPSQLQDPGTIERSVRVLSTGEEVESREASFNSRGATSSGKGSEREIPKAADKVDCLRSSLVQVSKDVWTLPHLLFCLKSLALTCVVQETDERTG